ncbi:hypothetical protein IscW_ISCW004555 [Ixodes scapularis]|uniref:Uncharacterized protein n=1 Tax=Ixodes scapularis TaxID=6945 RepID=B7PI81_IXOSC|nr:hypothetical protein IscW_ISCW004555 [Ixodes scapularis]|eukprot:XP_002404656.1 hypothetical protein IscW_ISCW004555 [Ixodes scapularis]
MFDAGVRQVLQSAGHSRLQRSAGPAGTDGLIRASMEKGPRTRLGASIARITRPCRGAAGDALRGPRPQRRRLREKAPRWDRLPAGTASVPERPSNRACSLSSRHRPKEPPGCGSF